MPLPQLSPQAMGQRNSIARTMMNIARPPPQPIMPQMPGYRPMMGTGAAPAPGAPPQGSPVPNMPQATMPLSPGVPPQTMSSPMAMAGMQSPMQPQTNALSAPPAGY